MAVLLAFVAALATIIPGMQSNLNPFQTGLGFEHRKMQGECPFQQQQQQQCIYRVDNHTYTQFLEVADF
jgi:hypothetical protein